MSKLERIELDTLKLLFVNDSIRDKMLEHLDSSFFNEANGSYLDAILAFKNNEGYFPKFEELDRVLDEKLSEFNNALNEEWDVSKYNDSPFLLKELEDWLRKRLLAKTLMKAKEAVKEGNLNEIADLALELVMNSNFSFEENEGFNPISPVGADMVYNAITAQRSHKVACGINSMDKLMDGGFSEKSLSGVVLGTHQGKTMWLCTCAANAIRNDKKVLYVSLEEGAMPISSRIIKNLIQRSKTDIRGMGLDEYRALVEKAVAGKENNLRVLELPESGTTPALLLSKIRSMSAKQKFVPDIIFVDYVGKMVPNGKRSNVPRHEQLAEVTVQIRDISKTSLENHPPIVTAWQYNKEGSKNKSGELTELGGSYAQAQTADIVWAGYRGESDTVEGEAEDVLVLKLAKGRECADDSTGAVVSLTCKKLYQAVVDKDEDDNVKFSANISPTAKTKSEYKEDVFD